MSWGQKKHTDAILRAKYEETRAREGPSMDARPMSTTIGLRSGHPGKERRAPTSASLVGNDMNIVRHPAALPLPAAPCVLLSLSGNAPAVSLCASLARSSPHTRSWSCSQLRFEAETDSHGASQVEWGTGEPQAPLVKPPPEPVAEKDRFAQFAAPREEAASLRSMVGNCRQPGGGFYTGACTHY